MFGFLIGTASLIGLIYVIRHTDSGGRLRRGWYRLGPSWALNKLFARLDTSPGQEKVIRNAVEDLFDRLRTHHDELHRSKRDLAEVIRSEGLDEVRLGELFARHDEVIGAARNDFVGALAQVHDALDERQRRRLARMVEGGSFWPHRRGWHGPYRDAACGEEG